MTEISKSLKFAWMDVWRQVVPLQALDTVTGEFEALRTRSNALLVDSVVFAPSVKIVAPAPGSDPIVVTDVPTLLIAAACDIGAAVGVILFNGTGATDPRWPVLPAAQFAPSQGIYFPAGLAVRAASGLSTVPVYLAYRELA